MKIHDVAIVGAGPAGSTCATLCAQAGLDVIVLERTHFPRDKVCGDCLNPAVWPILDRLQLSDRLLSLPHTRPSSITYTGNRGRGPCVPLPAHPRGEIIIRRRDFDQLLIHRAEECGASLSFGTAVGSAKLSRQVWELATHGASIKARFLIAADGRNSTVARLLGLLRDAGRDRVGLQTHTPHPPGYQGDLAMRFYRHGYGGMADLNGDQANLCLVAKEGHLRELQAEVIQELGLLPNLVWRTISPITRRPAIKVARNGLFLIGDAARVVEPFTGEGIYYAMRSGAVAADILVNHLLHHQANPETRYKTAHRKIYRGRLWINHLSRMAGQHPQLSTLLLPLMKRFPSLLNSLTSKMATPLP